MKKFKRTLLGIMLILAVVCVTAVSAVPAAAKTKKSSKKSTKSSTQEAITVKYQKPDVSGYDRLKFPLAWAGLAPAYGSATPTTSSFGEAYAAGNWKDASYWLMIDYENRLAKAGATEDDSALDKTDHEAYLPSNGTYTLDGVEVYCFGTDCVYVDFPQLGKDGFGCYGGIKAERYYGGKWADDTWTKWVTYFDGTYYGLANFSAGMKRGYCLESLAKSQDYLDLIDDDCTTFGYTIILRYPDANVAQYIGDQAALGSCSGIAYSQKKRLNFWNLYKKAGFDITAISYLETEDNHACADCSSFVSAIVKSAGYVYNIPALKNVHEYDTTETMPGDYQKAGFQLLSYSDVGAAGLQRGDVMISPGNHTGVFVPELVFLADVTTEGEDMD